MRKLKSVILIFVQLACSTFLYSQSPSHPDSSGTDLTSNAVVALADEMPSYEGGDYLLLQDLMRNLTYPLKERDAGIEGTVLVQFIVEKDGSISDVQAYREVPNAPGLTEAAIDAVRNLKKYKPGKKDGQPVRVKVIVPVRFVIK